MFMKSLLEYDRLKWSKHNAWPLKDYIPIINAIDRGVFRRTHIMCFWYQIICHIWSCHIIFCDSITYQYISYHIHIHIHIHIMLFIYEIYTINTTPYIHSIPLEVHARMSHHLLAPDPSNRRHIQELLNGLGTKSGANLGCEMVTKQYIKWCPIVR